MPDTNRFDSKELYFLTLYHEMTHSTGNQSRLKRFEEEDAVSAAFGSESYSREELVAEMGASMMAAEAGISSQELLEHSASYLQSWIRVLKGEPKMVVIAAAQAQKAADYILGKKFEDR